jgi:signal transduction histidine kinase
LRLLELSERELQLVAYDIHDGFVQHVLAAQMAIDAMLDRLATTDPPSMAALLRVRAHVRQAIDESRGVVSELRRATSDSEGLVESIQSLIDEIKTNHGLGVEFSFPQSLPVLSPLLSRSLGRIVQEALTNICKYAQTQSASVRLSVSGGRLRLEVEDRGIGFDPASVPPGRFGLEGMRHRARAFSGRTTIRSRPNVGTRITVIVPIKAPSGSKARSRTQPHRRRSARDRHPRKS